MDRMKHPNAINSYGKYMTYIFGYDTKRTILVKIVHFPQSTSITTTAVEDMPHLLSFCMYCKCWSDGASARHDYLRSLNVFMLLNGHFCHAKHFIPKLFIIPLYSLCVQYVEDYFSINMNCGQMEPHSFRHRVSYRYTIEFSLFNIQWYFNICAQITHSHLQPLLFELNWMDKRN